MVEARKGKPFKFLYMSGLQAERDQSKRPMLMTEYVLMRVSRSQQTKAKILGDID